MAYELANALMQFFDHGGVILQVILVVSILMWTLLIERYWYLKITHPRKQRLLRLRNSGDPGLADRFELSDQLEDRLPMIHSLVYVLPLLGLLGTVSGMIETFDVLTIFGNSNARGLSSGISKALFTTMAGLVTSLSGLFFVTQLSHRVSAAVQSLVRADDIPHVLSLTPLLGLRNRLFQKTSREPETE